MGAISMRRSLGPGFVRETIEDLSPRGAQAKAFTALTWSTVGPSPPPRRTCSHKPPFGVFRPINILTAYSRVSDVCGKVGRAQYAAGLLGADVVRGLGLVVDGSDVLRNCVGLSQNESAPLPNLATNKAYRIPIVTMLRRW